MYLLYYQEETGECKQVNLGLEHLFNSLSEQAFAGTL